MGTRCPFVGYKSCTAARFLVAIKLHCVVQTSFNYYLISIINFVYLSYITQSKIKVASYLLFNNSNSEYKYIYLTFQFFTQCICQKYWLTSVLSNLLFPYVVINTFTLADGYSRHVEFAQNAQPQFSSLYWKELSNILWMCIG